MALSETQQAVADLHKGKPELVGGVVVTRLTRRKESFESFLLEWPDGAEVVASFTKAAAYIEEGRSYRVRYEERRRLVEAQEEDPDKQGYRDFAAALSDANLTVTLGQDRERKRRRPQGTREHPFVAANEFSDPAQLDADLDARVLALEAERERRDLAFDLKARVRPSRRERPSDLAERLETLGALER